MTLPRRLDCPRPVLALALALALLPACGDDPAPAPTTDTAPAARPPLVAGLETPVDRIEIEPMLEPEPPAESADVAAQDWRPRAPHVRLDRDGRTVRGRVVDAQGDPVVDAVVSVVDPTDALGTDEAVALTDRSGTFTISSRRYDARWEGCLLDVRPRGAPCLRAVISEDALGRTLTLPETLPLRGELRFEDGSPVVDAEVRIAGDGDRFGPEVLERIVQADTRTDGHGRFTLALPVDIAAVLLVITHDEHASTRRVDLDAWHADPEGHVELALLEQLASLEIELAGPVEEHGALGRALSIVLVPVDRDADGRLVESGLRARREAAAGRGRVRFDRLEGDWIAWIDDGRTHDPLDGEPFASEPGRHRMTLPLARPGPWEPGIRWQLPVRLVDAQDETPWSPGGMPWPDVVVTDAEGRVFTEPLDAERGEAIVTGVMRPPVDVVLEVAGMELRRSTVQPGDLVSLPVDPEGMLDAFASLVVDVTALPDRDGPRRLQLELRPLDAPRLRPSTWVDRSVVRGLPPGRWYWELFGPELVRTSGELTVEPGGYAMVHAVPRE